MRYPKPVMKKSELLKMGFTEEWLMYVFRIRTDRRIAWKTGHKPNCPILFDTEELEKLRKSACTGK
jgi:hypothetical protein